MERGGGGTLEDLLGYQAAGGLVKVFCQNDGDDGGVYGGFVGIGDYPDREERRRRRRERRENDGK